MPIDPSLFRANSQGITANTLPLETYNEQNTLFSSTFTGISIDCTNETPAFLLKNPADSGKTVKLIQVKAGPEDALGSLVVRYYADPTISNDGTALTEVSRYIKDTPAVSAMATYRQPTISANGTLLSTFYKNAGTEFFFEEQILGAIILAPGHNLLITFKDGASAHPFGCSIMWVEV